MKKKIVVAVALLALVAACGGSDSGDGGENIPASSAKSIDAAGTLSSLGTEVINTALGAMGGGGGGIVVTKGDGEDGPSVNCTWSTQTTFECSASDTQGGSCTATGEFTQDTFTFSVSLSCDNFHWDLDTIDGSLSMTVEVNTENIPGGGGGSPQVIKMTKGEKNNGETGECTIDDLDNTFGEDDLCQLSETGCLEPDAIFVILFDIGSDGIVVNTECGTFTFGSDYKMSMDLCMSSTTANGTIGISGTFNGSPAVLGSHLDPDNDGKANFTCDISGEE